MIKLYKININEISAADYTRVYNLLADDLKQKIDAKQNADDKKRSLAAFLLLFGGAKELYKRDDFEIKFNENGKPICDFCHFNISHSGEWAVCVFSDTPIGVDIQQIKDIKMRGNYRFFTTREAEYVNSDTALLPQRFTEIFTKKEAAVKMLGGSLASMASRIDTFSPEYNFETLIHKKFIITICKA